MVLQTDKSGKFAICSLEDYLRMAEVHTCKDEEITQKEVELIQQRLSGHVSMWVKMLGLGEFWGHTDRMRETLIQKSQQVPPMCLLIKDHKPLSQSGLPQTRPVVTANLGMNVPLSDILSDLLEPVASAMENSGQVASSEHMLFMIDQLNREWEKRGGTGMRRGSLKDRKGR